MPLAEDLIIARANAVILGQADHRESTTTSTAFRFPGVAFTHPLMRSCALLRLSLCRERQATGKEAPWQSELLLSSREPAPPTTKASSVDRRSRPYMNIAASRRTQFHTRTKQSDSKIDLDLLVCSAHTLSHYTLSLHTLLTHSQYTLPHIQDDVLNHHQ
jgi:hypothetical protein